ncbi:MAG: PAS domain-containing protein [Gallionella sp.]|nr:PAS domain-containing protein [Gallionella sp.]
MQANETDRFITNWQRRYSILAVIWSALVVGSLVWDISNERQSTLRSVTTAAIAHINKDISFRKWASSHGGVYVPPTEHTPPNPYLKVPDRDVVTTTGKALTLMNPAYVLREMQSDFPDDYGTKSHITSLKLLNPKNAPDDWETEALRNFEKGEKEHLGIQQINGQHYLRLMRPFHIDRGCLKCHEQQGYKVGDIRGGISVAISLEPYLANERKLNINMALSHGAIWLLGLAGLGFSYRRDRHQADERGKAANELRASENQLRLLLDSAAEAIYGIDMHGNCTFCNPSCLRMLGYRHVDELIGKNMHDLIHYRHADGTPFPVKDCRIYHAFLAGTNSHVDDEVLWRADGTCFPAEYWSYPQIIDGQTVGAVVTFMDITERKRAEEHLRISEERLALAVRTGGIGIWDWDVAENKLLWDDAMYRLYGLRRGDFGGAYEAWAKALHPEDKAYTEAEIQAALRGEREYAPEFRVIWPDGSIHYIKAASHTLFDDKGRPLRMVGINYDLTERKLAEQELREKEERLALATIQNGVGVWDWNLVTQEMIWDDSMYSLYHIRREDFIGTEEAWRKALHPDDLHRGDQEVNDAIAGIKPFDTEFRVVWPNGDIRHIKAVAKVFRDAQGKPLRMLGINMDITELRRTAIALQEKTNLLRNIIDSSADYIFAKDMELRTILCNETFAKIVGKHVGDIIGKTDIENGWDPLLVKGDPAKGIRGYEQDDFDAIAGKTIRSVDQIYVDGKLHYVDTAKLPLRDDAGHTIGMFGISRDITERKQMEEEINKLNRSLESRVIERTAELEAANKDMESFSYSISHDLRAPLRAIDGFSRILQEEYAARLDDEGKRLLNVVGANARKMGQLIDDILAFSRAGRNEIKRSVIDMKSMVSGVWEELKPEMAGRDVQLDMRDIPPAEGDSAMMHQVVFNLLANAVKFTQHRANARIEVGGYADEHETVYHIKDNGIGFDMQYAAKLFGVFLRLHGADEFEGTGIGLAIVKRIITKHGGRVWAEGKVNEGATFYFALPKSQPAV